MKASVLNLKREEKGSIELNDAIFARKWNNDLVHQVFTSMLANTRRPWAHTKNRGEVSGGGKKPWRQKGTGRARHGSTRSPIWVGGGVTHGPRNDRDYSKKINKKMKKAALFTALSKKLADGELMFVDGLDVKDSKTKVFSASLKEFYKDEKKMPSTLIIAAKENKAVARAAKNIKGVSTSPTQSISLVDVLNHKNVIIEKSAVEEIK
ncbi:MAG: 50S ribosomal protein L4 [Candidatus Paceibacterota bacterium]